MMHRSGPIFRIASIVSFGVEVLARVKGIIETKVNSTVAPRCQLLGLCDRVTWTSGSNLLRRRRRKSPYVGCERNKLLLGQHGSHLTETFSLRRSRTSS